MRDMKYVWIAAAVAAAFACSKAATNNQQPEPPVDDTAKATQEPSGSSKEGPSCDEKEMDSQFESMLGSMMSYFERVVALVHAPIDSCEKITGQLVALEPHANQFVSAMTTAMAYRDGLAPECQKRLKAIGDTAEARLKAKLPKLEDLDKQMQALMKRCAEHPGFKEAVQKGLKFMKKKT